MCGLETKKKAKEAKLILQQASKFLEENQVEIIENILKDLEENQENSYVDVLKENQDYFKKSLEVDFKWMIDYAKIPNKYKVDINSAKYKSIYIVNDLQLAYCDFYKDFVTYIEDIPKGKAVKNRLIKLSNALEKRYNCK
jgi:hypothetical protein